MGRLKGGTTIRFVVVGYVCATTSLFLPFLTTYIWRTSSISFYIFIIKNLEIILTVFRVFIG